MLKNYAAGENIESICTKCKLLLDHTIVAVAAGSIAKVKCMTCGSVHKFKTAGAADSAAPKTKKERIPKKPAPNTWEIEIAAAKRAEQAYRTDSRYRVGDIVNHATFGKGIVRKLYTNKCDILFQDKERLMVSAN